MKKKTKTVQGNLKVNLDTSKKNEDKKTRTRSNSQRPKSSSSTQKTVKKMVRNSSIRTTK